MPDIKVGSDIHTSIAAVMAPRKSVGRDTISVTAGTPKGFADGAGIPATAVAAMIQSDGGVLSVTLANGATPSATVGLRLDDGQMFGIDSVLADVKFVPRAGTVNVQVCYFDKP